MNINNKLLQILCCPDCKGNLNIKRDHLECKKCQKIFAEEKGIINLLPKQELKRSTC